MANRSIWADRFLGACFLQGLVSFAGMAYLLYLSVFTTPGPARVVAGGGGGTWFVMGVLGFALIGVLGSGLSALFYHYLESVKGVKYAGFRTLCAWGHLIAGVVVSSVACLVAAWGGLQAGIAALPASAGGGGQNFTYIHENILGPLVVPLAVMMGIGLAGFFGGGLGYFLAWREALAKEGGLRGLLRGAPPVASNSDELPDA